jgi:FkbM family methyltransferase
MITRKKCIFLAFGVTILYWIFLVLRWDIDFQRFNSIWFRSTTNIVYSNFTCETWKQFSYINITKYENCLKWRPNESFWDVQGMRHTMHNNSLNSSSLIVEVGGNIGHDTSEFIKLYNSSIISFEPLLPMAKDLVVKFKSNPKIEIRPYGLGNRPRNIPIEPFDGSNAGTSVFRKLSSPNSSTIQQIQILEVIGVIENIRKTRTKNGMIDMISINCEGCEFEILPALIVNNLTQYFRIIQFGTHISLLTGSSCIYCQLQQALERTHQTKYHYSMLWEGWILKT